MHDALDHDAAVAIHGEEHKVAAVNYLPETRRQIVASAIAFGSLSEAPANPTDFAHE